MWSQTRDLGLKDPLSRDQGHDLPTPPSPTTDLELSPQLPVFNEAQTFPLEEDQSQHLQVRLDREGCFAIPGWVIAVRPWGQGWTGQVFSSFSEHRL